MAITKVTSGVLADDAVPILGIEKSDVQKRIKAAEENAENLNNDLDIAMNEIRLEVLKKIITEL